MAASVASRRWGSRAWTTRAWARRLTSTTASQRRAVRSPDGVGPHPAGGVDEAVDAPEGGGRTLGGGGHVVVVGDVDLDPGHPESLGGLEDRRVAVPEGDGAPLGHQDLGTGQTDPRGRPGDHDAAHGCIMTLMQSALRAATVA